MLQETREELLKALKTRFEKNMIRQNGFEWVKINAKQDHEDSTEKLWSLNEMERTGGTLFCDRRFDHIFVYYNGAESYF